MSRPTTSSGSDATGEMSSFLLGLNGLELDPDLRKQAVIVLADTIGVLLAASQKVAMRASVAAYPVGVGPCTVVGIGRADADRAALINGLGAHDTELDDVHTSSRTHPACVIVPASLA